MTDSPNHHEPIDWSEFEKKFFDGEFNDKPTFEVDQLTEFDEEFEKQLDTMMRYCHARKIPIVVGMALLQSESEEVDAKVRTVGKTLTHLPRDTTATSCELVAMSLIMKMPHEFSHMVLELAQMWRMMGATDRGNEEGVE